MTARIALRSTFSPRNRLGATSRFVRPIAIIAAWIAVSGFLGLLIGLAAVVLPPTGAFGIVAVIAVVLLWALPALPVMPMRVVRKAFFVLLVVYICVPFYYTIQIAGLPWISARRVAAFLVIAPFLIGVAASPDVRRRIMIRAEAARPIVLSAVALLAWMFLSILTSQGPTQSLSQLTDVILEWYVPFFAAIYVIEDFDDIIFVLKILCVCGIFVALAGIVEFRLQHRYFLDIYPKSMLEALIASNPSFEDLLRSEYRNGMYRANSIFSVSNSFGEFEAMIIPVALFFAVHGARPNEKWLGWVVVVTAFVGLVCSGARAGYMALLFSMPLFTVLWGLRQRRIGKASLVPAFIGLVGSLGFATIFAAVLFWPRARVYVLGDSSTAGSTQSRYDQWALGWPHILSNPITGHGFAMSGAVIQWGYSSTTTSVDSYPLTLLVECGVPALVFFTLMVCLPIWYGVRHYLTDLTPRGALSGALACTFLGYATTRLVLSVRENHVLLFLLLAVTVIINYLYVAETRLRESGEGTVSSSKKNTQVNRGFRTGPNQKRIVSART